MSLVVVVVEEDEDDWTPLRNKHVTDTVIDTYTHQKPHRTDKQTRQLKPCCLLLQTLQRKIGCFWRPQPASSLPLYPYLGTS